MAPPSKAPPASPEDALGSVLGVLGYLDDPEAVGTPARLLEVLRSFAPGREEPHLDTLTHPATDPVVLRDMPFHSLCVHHLLPFFGTVSLAYLPRGRIAGLGAFPRVVRHFARRPQLQERMGAQIADFLHLRLGGPVVVHVVARQMCVEMRGEESNPVVETWARRGPELDLLTRLLLPGGR